MSLKENDIRPADLMKRKEPALAHDKKYLYDRRNQFIRVNCPACNSSNTVFWGEKEGFYYEQCQNCRTILMNPRASTQLLEKFYKQSKNYEFWNKYIFPASDAVRKERIFKPRAEKLINYCKKFDVKGGTMLEVGAAFGTFCEAVLEHQFFNRIIAVEPTPGLAETCRMKGLETLEQTVETLELPLNSIDVIANFEVIEHLAEPFPFVQQTTNYLKKGGLFICSCPSGEGLGTLVLKEQAKVVDHEHVNYFNPHSLGVLLERCGLEVLEVSTPGELDLDLLKNALAEGTASNQDHYFFEFIIKHLDQGGQANFQKFLKENLLSSHLWIVGRKI